MEKLLKLQHFAEDENNESNESNENNENENNGIDQEKLENSIVEKIKGLFSKSEEDEKKPEDTKNLTMEEIEKKIAEKAEEIAQSKIDTLAKTTKEKAKKQQEINNKLANISDDFKELVEFKLKKDGNFDVDKYIEENPQAKKTTSTTVPTVKSSVKLSDIDKAYLDKLKGE